MPKVPTSIFDVIRSSYFDIFPEVNRRLEEWKEKARAIPNEELRTQALNSIESKTFHCEGGSIYATLAHEDWKLAIRFIVAYQTISDYLDNLCDRSTSLDPQDFRQLHVSMQEALQPVRTSGEQTNFYAMREEQDDGGYLQALVDACQEIIQQIPNYEELYPSLERLASLYIDLQVHKHVKKEERVPRLESWYEEEYEPDDLSWYEFSAASGSTLGIFCIISYGLNGINVAEEVFSSYFPYVQGLHIMLDYFIDQEEDREEGDLNFCFYYEADEQLFSRMNAFIERAKVETKGLPDQRFHRLIVDGLIGLYLSDRKANELPYERGKVQSLVKATGWRASLVYWNGKMYRKWKRR
ncbi:tetraprenyl-beta-curcumene synthase family protein [Allobacillus halotolerans]|uniref:Tetraprenyl-beta-curcumene synthase family protein n=1 Tax=Allobacillus halotolerans TaxID=570278 RepID=A0ABS6GMX6_9BACI|nr:tetraprenyl-beta-curcumene synthase family protein [Allobacillus halotolerans]MBU6080305.1 tetraprenyl-beta-curcumene synthase family protein [Allobacillus halotolerans]